MGLEMWNQTQQSMNVEQIGARENNVSYLKVIEQ